MILDAYDHFSEVMKRAQSMPFPKVPDPICLGNGMIQHVVIAPQNLPNLMAAAKKAGMYVLTDRFSRQRQGPLLPGTTFTV